MKGSVLALRAEELPKDPVQVFPERLGVLSPCWLYCCFWTLRQFRLQLSPGAEMHLSPPCDRSQGGFVTTRYSSSPRTNAEVMHI